MSIFDQLKAPFQPSQISWRIGSTTADKKRGMALAYIDARDVMDRLDEVCGPDGWQCTYPHANGKTVCAIGIRVCREGEGFEWVWKSDGAGDSDIEAEKGALSDAFKRSAVRWGIGRYLYHMDSPWVEITAAGRSFKITDAEKLRLEKILGGKPSAPAKATVEPVTMLERNSFMVECREAIASFDDPELLGTWFNSDAQKKARKDYQLDASQVATLKTAALDRINSLKGKKSDPISSGVAA
jgi:hypothetical protein